jgi:hypothetical protein
VKYNYYEIVLKTKNSLFLLPFPRLGRARTLQDLVVEVEALQALHTSKTCAIDKCASFGSWYVRHREEGGSRTAGVKLEEEEEEEEGSTKKAKVDAVAE